MGHGSGWKLILDRKLRASNQHPNHIRAGNTLKLRLGPCARRTTGLDRPRNSAVNPPRLNDTPWNRRKRSPGRSRAAFELDTPADPPERDIAAGASTDES